MPLRSPPFLKRLSAPGAEAFAILFALESLSRAVVATVLPLEAFRLLGEADEVGLLFFFTSVLGLVAGLAMPWLIGRTARRVIYSAGFGLLVLAAALYIRGGLDSFALGLAVRVVGTVAVTVCLSLYIMDHISREDLGRSEPMRLFYAAGAWCAGPYLGVLMAEKLHPYLPYLFSALMALITLGYFWFLRLTDSPALVQGGSLRKPAPSPLRNLPRFFAQPRLSLAWVLSLGRSIWWVIFFIYVPIYAVESGLGALAGGAIVSCGTAYLFFMPILGRSLRRWGIRRIFQVGYAGGTVLTLAMVVFWDQPYLAAGLLIAAALGFIMVDSGGNMLFMLGVKPRERSEMTAVYTTYRDLAEIAAPGFCGLLLKVFALPAAFVAAGVLGLGMTLLSSYIPRRAGKLRQRPARLTLEEPIPAPAPPVVPTG